MKKNIIFISIIVAICVLSIFTIYFIQTNEIQIFSVPNSVSYKNNQVRINQIKDQITVLTKEISQLNEDYKNIGENNIFNVPESMWNKQTETARKPIAQKIAEKQAQLDILKIELASLY